MKNKRICSFLILLTVCIVTAFSFLKGSAVSSQKNEIKTNPDTEYQITYELNGGRFEGEYPKTFKISQETSIPNPIKDGSEFLGWTINDNTNVDPVKDYKIPEMTQEDIKLTANWRVLKATLMNGQAFNSKVSGMSGFENVTEIRFIKGTPNPNGTNVAVEGEAMAYIEGTILTVACEGEIFANKSCVNMFYSFGSQYGTNKVLNKITFNNFNTSQVTNMQGMFSECESLPSIDLSNLNTSQVISMKSMFLGCEQLTSIKGLEKFNTSQVISMQSMFHLCSSLTNLDIRGFDTSKVTDMNSMFGNCSLLQRIDLSGCDTSQVYHMSKIFYRCSSLTNIEGLDDFNTSKATSMSGMFYYCNKLSGEITITNTKCNNYLNMFYDCSTDPSAKFIVKYVDEATKQKAREMVDTKYDGTTVGNVFLYEPPKPATLMNGQRFNSTIKGMSGFENVTEIRFVNGTPKPNGVNVAIEGEAKGYIEGNVLTVACEGEIFTNENCGGMFMACSSLTSIDLRNLNTTQATNMSEMFAFCNSLKSLDVTNLNTSQVTDMVEMFSYCSSLTSLVGIENWDTSQVTDMSNMFRDCISLTKLDLSKLNLSQLWNMGDMFYMCKNLSGEITITHPNPRFTAYLFTECSTNPKSKFVVNYTSGRREIAQNMIYTKSSNSNVVLGTEVNTLNEDIPNNEKPSVPDTVVLTIKDGNTTTTKEIIAGEIGSLNTPSKEGMIFSGYFYDAEFTKPVSERDIISEDTTIYIKWEEAPQEETPQVEEIPQEENKDESFGEVA